MMQPIGRAQNLVISSAMRQAVDRFIFLREPSIKDDQAAAAGTCMACRKSGGPQTDVQPQASGRLLAGLVSTPWSISLAGL
jgi:hypothetical protein